MKNVEIKVVSNTAPEPEKVNVDTRPLGIKYPMRSVSQRHFAVKKYRRWFKNSVLLGVNKVLMPLNDIISKGMSDKKIVIGSMYYNQVSHVDIILEYLRQELEKRGFSVTTKRSEITE